MCFLDGYGIGCLVLVKFTNGYTEIAQVERIAPVFVSPESGLGLLGLEPDSAFS